MEFIKIKKIDFDKDKQKKKVHVYFEFFDTTYNAMSIEFKKVRYAGGPYPSVSINGENADIDQEGWISLFGRPPKNSYSDDKVNILLMFISQYGWETTIDKNKVYIKYERKPNLINWKKDNKELRNFLIGIIALANHRGMLLKDNFFKNERELQAELSRLYKNIIEKKNLKELKCQLEHPIGRDFIDFLVTKNGTPFLVIECKLGDFESGIPQAKKYAKMLKVEYYGVCTENKIAVYKTQSNKLLKEFPFDEKGIGSFVQLTLKL